MAIPKTKLHVARVTDQVFQNLIGLQRDIRRNATTHRAMAVAQSPTAAILKTFFQDSAASYLTRIGWIQSLNDSPARFGELTSELARRGWNVADLIDPFNALKSAAQTMQAANVNNYAQIITACDQILASVDAPESLWPE